MRFTLLLILLNFLIFSSCKVQLSEIKGKQIAVTDSTAIDAEIESFITPYREHIKKDLDSILAYSPKTYSKKDGELNTAIGNLMADIVYSEGNPVFNKKTGNTIDAVVLNHGGIRSIISEGPITARTAYEVMPFENKIVVIGLKGSKITKITDFMKSSKRAHPIAGLNIVLDKDYHVFSATIKGKEIETDKVYYIATSDYLYNSGDNMYFFKPNESVTHIDYKIRNAMIDYFKKVDTINPIIDNRFIRKQ